jgi:hypothetical protein
LELEMASFLGSRFWSRCKKKGEEKGDRRGKVVGEKGRHQRIGDTRGSLEKSADMGEEPYRRR